MKTKFSKQSFSSSSLVYYRVSGFDRIINNFNMKKNNSCRRNASILDFSLSDRLLLDKDISILKGIGLYTPVRSLIQIIAHRICVDSV